MTSEDIKSGPQVISEFLDSFQGAQDVDTGTVTTIRDLLEAGKLSQTRLLSALAAIRPGAVAPDSNAELNLDEFDD
jgi:hypothetical protein